MGKITIATYAGLSYPIKGFHKGQSLWNILIDNDSSASNVERHRCLKEVGDNLSNLTPETNFWKKSVESYHYSIHPLRWFLNPKTTSHDLQSLTNTLLDNNIVSYKKVSNERMQDLELTILNHTNEL